MGRVSLLAVIGTVIFFGGLVQGSTIGRYPPPLFEDDVSYWENPNARSNEIRADPVNYRLPNNTNPIQYNVILTTNVHSGELNFKGVVEITIRSDEEVSKNIVVHARQLENFTATLTDTVDLSVKKLNSAYSSDTEFLTFTPEDNSELVQGRIYKLTIAYDGKLRTDNGGFYVSTYTNSAGKTVYLATTQFESTNARHGFPCYDEPAKRAKFIITINHDPSLTAISNMPVDTAQSSPGKTVFEQTPSMPTYLVAFIVSDFEYTSGSLNSLTQRIFSRPETLGDQEFALFSGIQITARLAEYYGVPFTLPKLDQVAVPDFAAGAMENWGIATYREEYLLYNPLKSTINTQTNIANVIGHEYTHMWFGDLVTIKWWTYLWLKEGFATMFSYKSADAVFPEWGMMQMFIVDEYQRALTYDGGNNPRPMTHYVQTPSEISRLYDSVSYSKAGSVLLMWENALPDTIFQAGLNKYLTLQGFTGAEEDDLFNGIQTAAKDANVPLPDTIKVMMGSWTGQGGVPVLKVERNYDNNTVTITQNSFYHNSSLSDEKLWYVPVNYATANNSDFRNTSAEFYLKKERTIQIDIPQLSKNDWLILNKQSTGYYRIQYDDKNWNLITDALIAKPQKIHPNNRASLLNDAYRLSSSAYIKHEILLNLMTYLDKEDQYAPWSTANSILYTFDRFLRGDSEYSMFKLYVSDLVENIYEKLGVNDVAGEQHFVKYIRNIAINLACLSGIESCLEETNNKLTVLMNEGISIEPNLQSIIFCNGLKQTSDKEFNYVYELLMSSDNQAQRRVLISSLGCAQNAGHVKKFVESSVSTSPSVTLRTQERTTLLSSAYQRSEVGLLTSIEFLSDNFDAYANLTTGFGGANPLDADIKGMSNYVVNENQETKLLALVEKVKDHPKVSDTLESTVKTNIKNNYDWLASNRDPLINWIVKFKSSGGASPIFATIVPALITICYTILRLF